jgi:hemolysin activation/secretion protein
LGNKNTLRGYPLNRFKGNSSLAYTLELRTWLLKFPQFYGLKFGGQLFTDAGRVFTEVDDANDLFKEYHQTVGLGGAMSVFNPDFILRGEIGFSEDVSRIYIGVGYMF